MIDTIFAIASGKPPSAIAVVRVSGPQTATIVKRMLKRAPAARTASLSKIWHPISDLVLDHGIALWFPGPRSYTGEDYLELHVHGGQAVLRAILDALASGGMARPAEPGEFSLRAFLNGKIDLASLEGLADLIHAQSELQRQQGIRVASGYLSAVVEEWRRKLVGCLALVEASIDFAEEADVPDEVAEQLEISLNELSSEFQRAIADSRRAEIIRGGFRVVFVGPPNVGKSTLLNALAKRDVAIVSDAPGTTRDTLEVSLLLGGQEVVFVDTAGMRDTSDPVEILGIERTERAARKADLILRLFESDFDSVTDRILQSASATVLNIQTKSDIHQHADVRADLALSAELGIGVDKLLERVRLIADEVVQRGELPLVIRERHCRALHHALSEINALLGGGLECEIVAEHLRLAIRSMESIVGRVDVEDVLGDIFARFCIGK